MARPAEAIGKENRGKSRRNSRSRGTLGGLVKADSIVRFTKRHQALHRDGHRQGSQVRFCFAYKSHSSDAVADFMKKFKVPSLRFLSLTFRPTTLAAVRQSFRPFSGKVRYRSFHTYPRYPQNELRDWRIPTDPFRRLPSNKQSAVSLRHWKPSIKSSLIGFFSNTRRPHWSLGLISP